MQDTDNGGNCVRENNAVFENSVLSAQFVIKPKTFFEKMMPTD